MGEVCFSGMFEVELFKYTSAQWRGWDAGENLSKKKAKKNLFFGYVMDSRCAPPLYEIGRILIIDA